MPRLCIASRRCQSGGFEYPLDFFAFDGAFGIESPIALPLRDQLKKIVHTLLFFSTGTELLRLDVPHHIAQIFADNVEFEIHDTARFDAVEIGVLVRVGNDRHFEAVGL